ncbi:hypothetical protein LEP1GSC132_2708 [Leptospira kirschneri str. 200803703]|uniref:Uncharacterized protein n=1 Tax=Leptospira kirschneri str. 200802841 TaxID=1193047 RepID=A0A828XTV2_9LEPT|nr:hypothetical protein LEP1GSC044_3151 [Leptospira kirschneri serovar Grippotyphosa str. RM52]EKO50551.1 hypothetical protein LEP1GSC131_4014 [Leptospira kirschneri str. 200802841]EKP06477.1 hypothetical protein LEP1GSC018_2167 [Leptospira kirschneri str. 2008720114]EKQ83522.1 hypothetical protein LEP1GSC064_2462 [Leptospira kirschneri serovar Grippotyphosa str. Moskva]EKR08965.1 hypothetical protein LEP1GSC122_0576 [Leptospira kirschneri serovar Valbuzzi str. 200702274]EMK06999.1 hypothetica
MWELLQIDFFKPHTQRDKLKEIKFIVDLKRGNYLKSLKEKNTI